MVCLMMWLVPVLITVSVWGVLCCAVLFHAVLWGCAVCHACANGVRDEAASVSADQGDLSGGWPVLACCMPLCGPSCQRDVQQRQWQQMLLLVGLIWLMAD